MSYQSKKLWDEVLDKIDQKYANEAAELFGKELCAADEEYGELVPVEARKLPQMQSKRRFVGGIVGFAAAAAVLALSVGAAVRYVKKDDIVQSDPKDSSVSEENSTNIRENLSDDITLPADPALYSEDYSIYGRYFCGRWIQSEGYAGYYDTCNQIYNIGYAPAENGLFLNKTYRFYGSIGFYEDEQGAYMAAFTYRDSGELSNAEIVYSPEGDSDTLYLYTINFIEDGEPFQNLNKTFVRDGEYVEENIGALNYLGVRRVCGEMGIDPNLIYKPVSYDLDGLRLTRQEETSLMVSDGVIINYRGEDRLEFAMKCAAVGNDTAFYNIALTKENGEWSVPALADYTEPPVFADKIPENTGELNRGILEEYFFGEWRMDGLLNGDNSIASDDIPSPDRIAIMYSDLEREGEAPEFISAFRGDEGAFAYTADGAVCFVPENNRQLMYRFADGNANEYTIYRLSVCVTAENRDLYGVLTELGRNKLFDTLGSGFEDTYNSFIEYYMTAVVNGDIMWLNLEGEPYFLCAAELSSDRVALAHKYYEKAGYRETVLVSIFEKSGDKWEFAETYYDIDYDYTLLEVANADGDLTEAEALAIYEEVFFGEWESEVRIDDTMVCSYSEEIWGTSLPYAGNDGYYMGRFNGGAFEMFFIPRDDMDSMYHYSEGVFLSDNSGGSITQKRDYSQKFVRTSKQFDKELHDMMTLSWAFGRAKLFDYAGGNFGDLFCDIEFSEDFVIDKNGVSWRSGIYQGYAASGNFDPVLVSLGEDRIIISQTYYLPIPTDYGYSEYDYDSTFENGKLKNFIYTFTKQDGVWTCEISDAGESVDIIISFDMDMSIFPNFFGVWSNGEASYTLDYYRDFCEDYISWITGFAETDSMWLMKVHRVDMGRSDIIPVSSGDVLFAIEKSDPDTVKIYRYADALPSGEPLKTFTRTEKLDMAFPDRGYISIYGLYALIDIMDDSSFESAIREYCFTGSITAPGGETLYADPSEISKPEYVILERSSGKVKLATTFYSENKAKAYDYVVTFINGYSSYLGNNWHMHAYEPAIYGLADAEKIPLDNGSYYAFNAESDGTHLYFFDSSDNIIYELDESIGERYIYTLNGSDLFLLDCSENNICRYVSGRAAGNCYVYDCDSIKDEENVKRSLMPEFLQFSGEYLLAGAYLGDEPVYRVYAPYDKIDLYPMITTDYLEISENGFAFEEDGERVFRNTADDSLDSVLPLLEYGRTAVWVVIEMDSATLTGNINGSHTVTVDGLTYYQTVTPMFPTFEEFKKYLEKYFTDDCVEEILNNRHITNYNGRLYALGGARGGDLTIAQVVLREVKQTDENNAEMIYDIYRWVDMDKNYSDWVMAEEPDETYSHSLVKTDRGWRFSNFYEPF